jgi:hypothetical protein
MVDDGDAGGGEDFRRGHRRISASDAGTVACRVHYCKMCGLLKIKYNKEPFAKLFFSIFKR